MFCELKLRLPTNLETIPQKDLKTLGRIYKEWGLQAPEIPKVPAQRFPIVAFIGPPGSGKTEAAKRLAEEFGFEHIAERWEENSFLTQSYSKMDREIGFKSQVVMALLKFQNHMRARILARQKPVIVEPSMSTDLAYALTFTEIGKISPGQLVRYLAVYGLLQRFLLPAEADMAISVVPSIDNLKARISRRGRDYEAGFSLPFLQKMTELCQAEEKAWSERCLCLGDMNYVDDTERKLFREFGVLARRLLIGENVRGSDGARLLPLDLGQWGVTHRHSDNCDFKLEK